MNARLDSDCIARLLAERDCSLGQPLQLVQETDSTNDDARRAVEQGARHGCAFLAEAQRAGRGRGAHRWHSPAGQNIYLSVVLESPLAAAAVMAAPLVAGVVLSDLVDRLASKEVSAIKWPNDVYVDGRKIAGILVEAVAGSQAGTTLIMGLGLNVATMDFEPPLDQSATSLKRLGIAALDRNAIVADLLALLGSYVVPFLSTGDLLAQGVHRRLRARDWLAGKALSNGQHSGMGAGIDRQGRLLLRQEDGSILPVVSGEVRLQ